MKKIEDLEKKINSELTTKIKESKILHNQLYLSINSEEIFFLPEIIKFISSTDTPSSLAASSGLRFISLRMPRKLLPERIK